MNDISFIKRCIYKLISYIHVYTNRACNTVYTLYYSIVKSDCIYVYTVCIYIQSVISKVNLEKNRITSAYCIYNQLISGTNSTEVSLWAK